MTVHVTLEAVAKEGRYTDLRDWFVKIIPDTRGFEGCVSLEFVHNQDNPNHILIMEKWNTRQDYERYLSWRQEIGTMAEFADLVDGELKIQFFDPMGV
jgi:quinol monooxygenase YgiN